MAQEPTTTQAQPTSTSSGPWAQLKAMRQELKRQEDLGKQALRLGLKSLLARPTLLGWKVGASIGVGAINLALLATLLSPLASDFPGLNDALMPWLSQALQRVLSAPYLVGAAGALAVTTFAKLLLESHVEAGVWGYMRLKILGETVPARFGAMAAPKLAGAMFWRLLRSAVRAGLGLLMVMTYASLLLFNMSASPLLASLATGALYAGMLIFALGLTVMFELSPALMTMREERLGESLLEAMALGWLQLGAFLRILSTCALLLSPAGILMALAALAGALSQAPQTQATVELISLLAQGLMFLALSLAATLFRCGTFWLVALEDGSTPPGLEQETPWISRFVELRHNHPTSVVRQDFMPALPLQNTFKLSALTRQATDDEPSEPAQDDDALR